MKKLFTTVSSLVLSASLFAQIQVVRADFGDTGDKVYVGFNDAFTTPLLPGAAGAGITWDFSTLKPTMFDSVMFIASTGLINAPEVATHAIVKSGDTTYYIIDNNAVTIIELPQELPGFEVKLRQLAFPLNYQNSFSDTVNIFIVTTPGQLGIPFPADSVRIQGNVISNTTADGHGTLKTPKGSYTVLRTKSQVRTNVNIAFKLLGTWNTFGNQIDTQNAIVWYAKNGKYPIATANLDSAGYIADIEWQVDSIYKITPTGLASLRNDAVQMQMYPNPANTVVYIATEEPILSGTMLDMNGREVMQITGNTTDVSSLSNGLYQVLIKTEKGIGRKRLLIQH